MKSQEFEDKQRLVSMNQISEGNFSLKSKAQPKQNYNFQVYLSQMKPKSLKYSAIVRPNDTNLLREIK